MEGIICVNKPSGFTSFDVVAKMKGIAKMRKIGHAGTLDPMATGVLPLFFGNATKACHLLPADDKQYLATVQFGVTTDTLDRTGTILTQSQERITQQALAEILPTFLGEIQQIPPMYSAVKIGGKKLYQLAREGKTIERSPRPVTIYTLSLERFDEGTQTADLRVHCSAGTYLRSLADDIGRLLGVGGMLTTLVREMAAGFSLSDCHTLEELQQAADVERLSAHLLPTDAVFDRYPVVMLSPLQAKMFLNGVKLDLHKVPLPCTEPFLPSNDTGIMRVYAAPQARSDAPNAFLGLARPDFDTTELVIVKLFHKNG